MKTNLYIKRICVTSLIAILFVCPEVMAQQFTPSSQYMFNSFVINPAVAGSNEKVPIVASLRRQWVHIKDAPVTQTLTSHAYVGQMIGIGLNIFNDVAGPSRRSGLSFSAARHIQVDKSSDTWLSFGLSGIFFQYAFDPDKLIFDQPNDPVINTAAKSKLTPDAAAGLFLYNKDFYAGLSCLNMMQTQVNLFDINYLYYSKVYRTYFLTGGYDFVINEEFSILPSVLVKYSHPSPVQVDINVKAHMMNMFWAGVSYRTSDAVVLLAGIDVDKFSFGYTYDIVTNPLKSYTSGTHEIYVGLRLDNVLSKNGHHTNHYRAGHRKNPYKRPHHR